MSGIKFRFIAVEGPIGVGKTSFADALARRLDAEPGAGGHLQPVPRGLLPRQVRGRVQAQLFFLLTRYRQQLDLRQRSLFQPITISDYLFARTGSSPIST